MNCNHAKPELLPGPLFFPSQSIRCEDSRVRLAPYVMSVMPHSALHGTFWKTSLVQPSSRGTRIMLDVLLCCLTIHSPCVWPLASLLLLSRAGLLPLGEISAGSRPIVPHCFSLGAAESDFHAHFLVGAQRQLLGYSGQTSCGSLPSPTSHRHQNGCAPVWKLQV